MTDKEESYKRIRDINFKDLSSSLNIAIEYHYPNPRRRWDDNSLSGHEIDRWENLIKKSMDNIPPHEDNQARLRQLLKSKIEALLENNCVKCAKLVQYLFEKYKLGE